MSITVVVVGVIVALILLLVIAKIIKSCLPKIVIGLIILGGLAYLIYTYLIK
jgi:hypothetical protein